MRLNFLDRGGAAQACNVGVFRSLAEDFFQLRAGFVAAEGEVKFFPAIEPDEVGEEPNLRG